MTDKRAPGHGPVNPTLTSGAFVLPPAEVDLEAEARFHRQLVAIDRETRRPRARLARGASFVWRWAANLALAAVISGGLSLWVTNRFIGDAAVVTALSKPQPEVGASCSDRAVPCVHAGDPIAFVQDMRRFEVCGGDVVELFSRPPHIGPAAGHAVELIQQRRPVQNPAVTVYPNVRIATETPRSLTPGRWGFSWSVDSRCPERRRVDEIASFEFEVLP